MLEALGIVVRALAVGALIAQLQSKAPQASFAITIRPRRGDATRCHLPMCSRISLPSGFESGTTSDEDALIERLICAGIVPGAPIRLPTHSRFCRCFKAWEAQQPAKGACPS